MKEKALENKIQVNFPKEVKIYDNASFDNYDCGGFNKSVIKDQFVNGCADPYILRYDGMYYLYITTSGLENYGLRAWKSKDLLNWEKCQGKGLKKGYVIKDEDEGVRFTRNAYAPEVYYFNGKFYLIISPGDAAVCPTRGHRILVADNPEGPFEKYTDQIDAKIDGTLLIDDDEEIYFLHATPKGITLHNIKDMKALTVGSIIPATDGTGAWTEGPGICKIRGWYYLTYTGCHYQTPGYQVLYAVSDNLNKFNDFTIADSFIRGANNPILLNCDLDRGHVGLGHSINFLGPDLDSTYICYHNLDHLFDDGMTHRSMNIDRLLVSDGFMTGTNNKYGAIYPKWPFFEARGLQKGFISNKNFIVSNKDSFNRFTAEFNVRSGKDTKVVFSYNDEKNYVYIKSDFDNHKIQVIRVKSGKETLETEGFLKNDFKFENNHTYRVAYDGTLNVYFDNMRKITAKLQLNPGKVGYLIEGKRPEIGYTAISSEANGSSDANELKQCLGEIPSPMYLKENLFGNFELFRLTAKKPVSKVGGKVEYSYTNQINMNQGDFVRYSLNFKEDGYYGINFVTKKSNLGKKILVAIDGENFSELQLPSLFKTEDDTVRVLVKFKDIKKGFHVISIKAAENGFSFVSFNFTKVVDKEIFKNDMSKGSEGIVFRREGYFYDNIHKCLHVSGKRAFASFTSQEVSDFQLSIDLKVTTSDTNSPIGVIFRQKNYAYHEVPNQNFVDFNTHIQGYFLEMGSKVLSLWKYNFGSVKSYEIASYPVNLQIERYHNLKVVAKGNNFKAYVEGNLIMDVNVPLAFTTGAVGLYSIRGSGDYKNIDFKTL